MITSWLPRQLGIITLPHLQHFNTYGDTCTVSRDLEMDIFERPLFSFLQCLISFHLKMLFHKSMKNYFISARVERWKRYFPKWKDKEMIKRKKEWREKEKRWEDKENDVFKRGESSDLSNHRVASPDLAININSSDNLQWHIILSRVAPQLWIRKGPASIQFRRDGAMSSSSFVLGKGSQVSRVNRL